MRKTISKDTKLFLLFCWMLLIILFSLIDYKYMPAGVKEVILFKRGYFIHFGVYFLTSFLTWLLFRGNQGQIYRLNAIIFLISAGIEFVQMCTPSRAFNPVDMAMNFSGIFCFNLLLAGLLGGKNAWRRHDDRE